MTRSRSILLSASLLVLLGALLVWGALRLAGVTALHGNHVIATLEVEGLASQREAENLRRDFAGRPGVRGVELAPRSLRDNGVWLARVQFRADSPTEGRRRILAWLDEWAPAHPMKLVRATHFRYRVIRTGGDVVFGPREEISLAP